MKNSYSEIMKALKAISAFMYFFLLCTQVQASRNQLEKNKPQTINMWDTILSEPYIDIDEWREFPIRHRYMHGGFKGKETRFSFYFPPKKQYQSRFYQYITPVPDSENISQGLSGEDDRISFSIQSGAYFVETNGGGKDGDTFSGGNKSIGAYGANAACAQYSKIIAKRIYGEHRTYGYAFGGSGGAYRTIGGFESTSEVWDGVVPFVLGSPMAIPNVFSVRMHAMRILKDKFPQIVDAFEPGSDKSPYEGLSVEECQTLAEVTRMGFPAKAWFAYETMGVHAFTALYNGIRMADPSYFKDFWSKPGYLGYDAPQSLTKDRLQYNTKIKKIITKQQAIDQKLSLKHIPGTARGSADGAWKVLDKKEADLPIAFIIEDSPNINHFIGGDIIMKSGEADGIEFAAFEISRDTVILGETTRKMKLRQVKDGDELIIDNSNYLALQTYHRHQVPGLEYKVWDQFRDYNNRPIYPQRPMLLGPVFTSAAAGVIPSGKFNGKMILIGSLWDQEAFPWQADWYRSRVEDNLKEKTNDHFVLWYVDKALHGDFSIQEYPTQTVSYLGVLQQALLDLSTWVEKGIAPPLSTNYKIKDGQVLIDEIAEKRKGIQPVVEVKVDEKIRFEANINQEISFEGIITIPENTGTIISAEWDFDGSGCFSVKEKIKNGDNRIILNQKHTFSKPGTYFVTLRGVSQRYGNTETSFARIYNLAKMRVVIK